MSLTWAVSRYAIVLTESVRSRHEPDMPRTRACPPSLPSVPTSLATRVTSSVNVDSWSTRLLTVRPTFRNSPRSGCPFPSGACVRNSIRGDRSPSATADSTRLTSETGRTRSSTRAFELSIAVDHEPSQAPVSSRSVSFPSRPTIRRTRASSPVRCRLRSATSLKTAAISAITPSPDTVSRLRKFPSRIDTRAAIRRFRAAVSTSVVPLRVFPWLLGDCPPFARVFVPRVAAPDSTVSLPQGSTVTAVLGYRAPRTSYYCVFSALHIRLVPEGCCPPYALGTQPARTFTRSLPSVSPWPNQAITVRQLRTSSAHPPDGNTADRHPNGPRR